eukprot:3370677-Amphidinium_carterae.1
MLKRSPIVFLELLSHCFLDIDRSGPSQQHFIGTKPPGIPVDLPFTFKVFMRLSSASQRCNARCSQSHRHSREAFSAVMLLRSVAAGSSHEAKSQLREGWSRSDAQNASSEWVFQAFESMKELSLPSSRLCWMESRHPTQEPCTLLGIWSKQAPSKSVNGDAKHEALSANHKNDGSTMGESSKVVAQAGSTLVTRGRSASPTKAGGNAALSCVAYGLSPRAREAQHPTHLQLGLISFRGTDCVMPLSADIWAKFGLGRLLVDEPDGETVHPGIRAAHSAVADEGLHTPTLGAQE